MHAPESFKACFMESLEERGIPSWEIPGYGQFLDEFAEFMGACEPASWEVGDLERFFSSRFGALTVNERAVYGTALGVLSEVLAAFRDGSTPDDSTFDRVHTSSALPSPGDTGVPLEAPVRRAARSGNPTGEGDDFLNENQQRWRQKRRSPGEWVREPTADRRGPEKSSPPAAGIDVSFHTATRTVRLVWRGFVVGDNVRSAVKEALQLQRQHDCSRWLLDMRVARVMSLADSAWFENWLVNAGLNGVRQLAVINPDHVITSMQLQRLSHTAEASTIGFAREDCVEIRFFDAEAEAQAWFARR